MQRLGIGLLTIVLAFSFSSSSEGFPSFKKALSKKYAKMKVSCNACHVKSKPKSERNEFGKLFFKEFKDKKLTENFKKLTGDEKKKFEQEVMIPAFNKALEKIKKMKKKDTEKTYDELIKAGEIPNIDTKTVEREW